MKLKKSQGQEMNQKIIDEFKQIVGFENVETNVNMSRYTTFKVGGPADCLVSPASKEQIKDVIDICKKAEVNYYIIGNGSNLLVKDTGFSGVIIRLNKNFSQYQIHDNIITANGGILLSQLARTACDNSLTGLEFASGIPGTLGGAVTMNAGAYGGEMSQVVLSVKVLDINGEVKELTVKELKLGYRTSIFQRKDYILLEAGLRLEKGDKEKIQSLMTDLACRRKEKQPLEYPSAGSTFKRPKGYYAGKLIMDAGLAGYRIGDAQVSAKHCGFVINTGNATASDILKLIEEIKDVVYGKFGVTLESEVRILG